jgi:tRNA1Val (adenine37-N6)-methyltransferase
MSIFRFKQFDVIQEKSALKVGTDAMLLGALIEPIPEGRLLEIGSGTGVISLMLAQRTKSAKIEALEIDDLAAEESKENFIKSPWSDRLFVHHADFFQWRTQEKYDLIFSNPPFYVNGMLPSNERLIQSKHVQFDFAEFLVKASLILAEKGVIWFILNYLSFNEFYQSAVDTGLFLVSFIRIEGKPGRTTRMIVALSRYEVPCVKSDFLVRDDNNRYSNQYKAVTKEFHYLEL